MTPNVKNNHSRVTILGRKAGKIIADMADYACVKLIKEGEQDERCKSCAFTHGTVPNGCEQTQADVLKAVTEGVPFLCHQNNRKGWPCHGWYSIRATVPHDILNSMGPCNWDFSLPDAPELDIEQAIAEIDKSEGNNE